MNEVLVNRQGGAGVCAMAANTHTHTHTPCMTNGCFDNQYIRHLAIDYRPSSIFIYYNHFSVQISNNHTHFLC